MSNVYNNGLRILIVEDSSLQQEIIKSILERHILQPELDVMIFYAESIEKAATILTIQCLDVIVADLDLPDSCGIDTVRTLHSLCPSIPLIVFSSIETTKSALECIQAGATYYIYKSNIDSLPLAVLLFVEKHFLRKAFMDNFLDTAKTSIKEAVDKHSWELEAAVERTRELSRQIGAAESERAPDVF